MQDERKNKNIRDVFIQIECIYKRMKNVNEELDYIKKIYQKLILDIQKIIENANKTK